MVKVAFDGPIPLFVAGQWEAGERPLEVHRPYDGSPAGATWYASADQMERAVAAAHAVRHEAAALPLHVRADVLGKIAGGIAAQAEDLAEVITAENGKPITWARAEVARAVSVFRWAAEHTRTWSGEVTGAPSSWRASR